MSLEEQFIENEYNPFIIFNSNEKIVSLNTEAQYLLSKVESQVIYDLTTAYSPSSYGFKTTFIDLTFGYMKFFALTIGYINEDKIAIKLYQQPSFEFKETKLDGDIVNIYTLIDLCISNNSISNSNKYHLDLDPSIPDIKINIDLFVRLLSKMLDSFKESDVISLKLFCLIGEHLIVNSKKFPIFSISIVGSCFNKRKENEILTLAEKCGLLINIQKELITLNIPMITK